MKKNSPPSIVPLNYQYSYLHKADIPNNFITMPVNYRKKDIEEYEVIFFHRLLKNNYGEPSDIEWEDVRTDEKNGLPIIEKGAKEWRYYLKTDSGNVIQVGTKNDATYFEVNLVLQSGNDLDEYLDENKESDNIKDTKKFIDSLLKEAKYRGEKFDLNRELAQGDNLVRFFAKNLFWSNYTCAELMIEWVNRIMPEIVKEEFKGLQESDFQITKETELSTVRRLDKYLCADESFIISGLLYYYMAIEAFINLIYKALLLDKYKKNKSKSTRNLEDRFNKLDIEIKLILMPHVCHGFKSKHFDAESEIYKNFLKLRDYRNTIIHGNIMDSANEIIISEYPFSYNYFNNKQVNSLFPYKRHSFKEEHLWVVKNIVDELMNMILQKMDDNTVEFVKKKIISSAFLDFIKDKNGIMRLY
jgi:hypothetical protein